MTICMPDTSNKSASAQPGAALDLVAKVALVRATICAERTELVSCQVTGSISMNAAKAKAEEVEPGHG